MPPLWGSCPLGLNKELPRRDAARPGPSAVCAGLRGLRRPPAHTSRARLPVGLIKHSVLPRVVPRVSHGKDTLKCPTVDGVVCRSPSPGENPQPGARGPHRMASVPDPPQLGWGQRAGEARLERAFNASFIRTHPALSAGPAGGKEGASLRTAWRGSHVCLPFGIERKGYSSVGQELHLQSWRRRSLPTVENGPLPSLAGEGKTNTTPPPKRGLGQQPFLFWSQRS